MARDDEERDLDEVEEEGGLRPFWSGTLTFGLVSMPVELYSALGHSGVSLHLLSPDGQPVRRRYVTAEGGEPLEREQIVRGVEAPATAPARKEGWVTVSDEELASLEPQRSREIDLRRFVARDAIDPIYGEKSYVLLPEGEVTKPYRLLAATMEKLRCAGVATFVMRGREVAIAIYADDGVLRAQTLRQQAEIRSAEQVGLPTPSEPDAGRVGAFKAAIKALTKRGLDKRGLGNEGAAALRALAEKKRKSHKDLVEVPVVEGEAGAQGEELAPIVDIVSLLKERMGRAAAAKPTKAAKAATAKPRRRASAG